LIQKLITNQKEMPHWNTICRQEFISSAGLQPYETKNPGEPTSPHLDDDAGQGSEAKQKACALDEQAEESLSLLSHHTMHRLMQLKGGEPDDTIRQRGCPPRNVGCGPLWTLARLKNTIIIIIRAESDSLIG
jgi:hypothetical protein